MVGFSHEEKNTTEVERTYVSVVKPKEDLPLLLKSDTWHKNCPTFVGGLNLGRAAGRF